MQYQIEFQSDLFPIEDGFSPRSDGRNRHSELYQWVFNLLSESGWDCNLLDLKAKFPKISYELSYAITAGKGARYTVFCGLHPNYDSRDYGHGVWFIRVKRKVNILSRLFSKVKNPTKDSLAVILVKGLVESGCSKVDIVDQIALEKRSKKIKDMAANSNLKRSA